MVWMFPNTGDPLIGWFLFAQITLNYNCTMMLQENNKDTKISFMVKNSPLKRILPIVVGYI